MPKLLGKAIKRIRQKNGLTQQEAATKYGCSMRWWQTLEEGSNLSVTTLTKVAKVLNVPRWKLLQ